MMREFAKRSPKVATGLIYAAGFVGGTLIGFGVGYLVSGTWKPSSAAFGMGFGTLALALAQRRGVVPEVEELNRPISLFGRGGFQNDGRR